MIYELHFHPLALKEWRKITKDLQDQFKKILKRRLENPHVVAASLRGHLQNCYKIKLRRSGYPLVYQVNCKHALLWLWLLAKEIMIKFMMMLVLGKINKPGAIDQGVNRAARVSKRSLYHLQL